MGANDIALFPGRSAARPRGPAYLVAVAVSSLAAWTLLATWDKEGLHGEPIEQVLQEGLIVYTITVGLGATFAYPPYRILLWIGQTCRWLSLPYALFSGAVLSDLAFQASVHLNILFDWPADPFTEAWGRSPAFNGAFLIAGLVGGWAYWFTGLRLRAA